MCTVDPLMCDHYEYLKRNKVSDCQGKCGCLICDSIQKYKGLNMDVKNFETKDSGKREEFESGMVRDTQEGKLRFDLAFDGPLSAEIFEENELLRSFNIWYQDSGLVFGAKVINIIAQREGGIISLFERYTGLMTRGAVKYAARNWMKATGQAELERFRASAARHLFQYIRGDKDEDHAAAVWFNINGAEFVLERLNETK